MAQQVGVTETPAQIFGRELRRLRKKAGLTQTRVARSYGCSGSLISGIERAIRVPQLDFAEAMDRLFGLTDTHFFERLADRIHRPIGGPHWYARWAEEIEPVAVVLRTWDPLLIPGLLQTAEYAKALFRGRLAPEEEVEQLTAARMRRQEILNRPNPPTLSVILDEWVLRRPIGGPVVMAEQLAHLLELAQRRNVTIQLVPYDTWCSDGLLSSFCHRGTRRRADRGVRGVGRCGRSQCGPGSGIGDFGEI
ncbi:XRE family transcriptional regulator [Spongiactinospora rosea]|uniref:XRE family transcriptional regulator n=1 Tax=Spongiactinospora rosea TaxID=2248750 RepID=A0A366LTL6_9ACTN|nr:helix-turn-helix transcriptional regulator [Spongiactinospora rosea]RBQ17087.1 XRE family transcriptional regulator [Spongiactinospora rosea]